MDKKNRKGSLIIALIVIILIVMISSSAIHNRNERAVANFENCTEAQTRGGLHDGSSSNGPDDCSDYLDKLILPELFGGLN